MEKAFWELLHKEKPGDALAANLQNGNDFNLPFLKLAPQISAGPYPWHSGSVLDHIARCMNDCFGDPMAVWMALAHDCGKLTTPCAMLPHHYGHELRGLALVSVWAQHLVLDDAFEEAGSMAAGLHMRAGHYPVLRPGKKLSILQEIFKSPHASSFLRLINADTRTNLGDVLEAQWQAVCRLPEDLPLEKQIGFIKYINKS